MFVTTAAANAAIIAIGRKQFCVVAAKCMTKQKKKKNNTAKRSNFILIIYSDNTRYSYTSSKQTLTHTAGFRGIVSVLYLCIYECEN